MKILGGILLIITIVLLYASQTPWAGWLFLIPCLLVFGTLLGTWLYPSWLRRERVFVGSGLLIAWIAILGSLLFYFWQLNIHAIAVILFSFAIILFLPIKKQPVDVARLQAPSLGPQGGALRFAGLFAAYAIFVAALLRMLSQAGTFESIRSPWGVLPWQFFLIFFLAVAALIVIVKTTRARLALEVGLPLIFIVFSITFFVYPIGYGFDSFVHHATENYIAEHGTITPKPFSYVGQYALVMFLHHQTNVPIELADRLILPIILTLFAIFALRRGLAEGLGLRWRAATLGALLLPIVPFTQWITTTPQGLGNAFAFLTIALVLQKKFKPGVGAGLAALAALVTHPLAGVPALILFAFTLLNTAPFKKLRLTAYGLRLIAFVLGSITLPALFWLYGLFTGTQLLRIPQFDKILEAARGLVPQLGYKFTFWHDFIYLYGLNVVLITVIVAVVVWLFLRKQKKSAGLLLLTALITTINAALLLVFVNFSYLPITEQAGYAARLGGVGLLFLIPLVLVGVIFVLWRTDRLSRFVGFGVVALIAGLVTVSLYLSYPHHDAYNIERGWSVSAADLEAVHFINADAGNRDFIVLANQSVSAAALREFGFKKYYNEIFYYPIPTGGQLYQYFHDASYGAPVREKVVEAMGLVDVDLGYFVVNQYWWKADKLAERVKEDADKWWNIGDGRVHVFRFELAR